jgi:putative ABC transport system permease protein
VLGPVRLFRRQLLADRGAALTVAVVVLVVAALLAAWPRAIDHIFTEEVREQVTQAGPRQRDVTGQVQVYPPQLRSTSVPGTEGRIYGRFEQTLREIRADATDLVLSVLGEPYYQLLGQDGELLGHVPEAYNLGVRLTLVADPQYSDHIEVTRGELPAGIAPADDPQLEEPLATMAERLADEGRDPSVDLDQWNRPVIVDVALSSETAERLEWPLGQVRPVDQGPTYFGPPVFARPTGIFEAVDPEADYWAHGLAILRPFEEIDPDLGLRAYARGFIAPVAVSAVGWQGVTAQVVYPVDGSGLTAADGPVLVDQLRAFTARGHPMTLGDEPIPGMSDTLLLSSGTIGTLTDTMARQASATALLGLVAAGPFGVALAVLALGSRLVVERRRRAMSLVVARGASVRQIRALLATEGALLGLPAGVLALVGAWLLVPGDGGLVGIALPLAVGLAPLALLPFVARPSATRTQRTDLGRRRWALDGLVVATAAVAVVMLNRRGLVSDQPGVGADPLLVATPLLVAVAVCVLVLRIYPVPVSLLGRLLVRRRGLVGYVGILRAVRDPAAGLAPVLALVVGLSVAVFSTMLWSTTQAAGTSTSINDVGADVRATGPILGAEHVASAEEIPEVIRAVTVVEQGRAGVTVGNRRDTVDVFITDTVTLAEIQADLTGVAQITPELNRPQNSAIPVMMSARLGTPGADGRLDLFGGIDIAAAGVADQVAGMATTRPWVLIDRAALDALGPRNIRPARTMLLDTGGAAIDESVLMHIFGADVRISTATDVLAEVRAGAVGTGLMASFALAVAAVGVLSAVAVLLTMVIAAPSRGRLFSQLRTLGLSGRQAHGLAVLEMIPVAAMAVIFGTGLGIGISWLVFPAIDLRPLTGNPAQPPVTVDWTLVGGAAAVFVGIVGVAVAIAVASSRRLRLGTVLRVGEEL